MHEEINLKISQFVDEELEWGEGLRLLNYMEANPDAADVYRRYEMISHAVKTAAAVAADDAFVARVSAQIKSEPTVFCPQSQQSRRLSSKFIAAVAASLAAVAVIAAGVLYYRGIGIAPTVQMAQEPIHEQIYAVSSTPETGDKRFNEYLEAHGATLYSGGYSAARAFGQVASYGHK
jgi:sigma-E factor negative regulatory protein RseA